VSVSFSLRSIQMDLAQSGHTYSLVEVREALNIMSKTNIEIRLEGGGFEYKGNILVALALARQGSGVRCFCSLNPLVSQAIRNLRFRTYDYTKCISYQAPLSRYLHKRISHYYKQADQKNPYTIMLSTLFNDSGHSMHSEVPRNKPKMEMVLSELAAKNVITTYKISPILEKKVKPKILDYKVDLTPSIDFINEIISANKREGDNLLKMGLPTLE
jgi:hypothetical protein